MRVNDEVKRLPGPDRSIDELARAAVGGDDAALNELVRSLWPRWFAVAHRLLADRGLAEEVAQDTALRVVRSLPRFAFRSAFATWSYRIALNAARDARVKRGRVLRLHADHEPAMNETLDPATRVALRRAVAALPPELAEVITLRYDCDLRFEDMARVLDLPVGTVSTRLRRALARLGPLLEDGTPR